MPWLEYVHMAKTLGDYSPEVRFVPGGTAVLDLIGACCNIYIIQTHDIRTHEVVYRLSSMAGRANADARILSQAREFVVFCIPASILLISAVAASLQMGICMAIFTRTPASVVHIHPFIAILSKPGILLLTAFVPLCSHSGSRVNKWLCQKKS